MTLDSASLLQQARLTEALAALKEEVRSSPAKAELRTRLFALNCVLGKWDKAQYDLEAIRSVDPSWMIPGAMYQAIIRAEPVRRDVFAGKARPLVMGEPEAWLAWNIQALEFDAIGKNAEAAELRSQSWDAAPEYKCSVDGQACQWISDADRRIGPVLEAYLDGKYYWIPFGQLKKIVITPPEFLVEAVWVPATLTVSSGAELSAHLPARYPGSEESANGNVSLGQLTEWVEDAGGAERPIGQKILESDVDSFGMLSCRMIEFG